MGMQSALTQMQCARTLCNVCHAMPEQCAHSLCKVCTMHTQRAYIALQWECRVHTHSAAPAPCTHPVQGLHCAQAPTQRAP
eukprot:45338-Eustigmatos_ZCMA.PRE.1